MQTITLKINEKSKMGKVILDLIKISSEEKSGVQVVSGFNLETIKAIEDVENGRTFRVKNSKELFKELGI
ncbi:MAG: hypothetical protein RL264_2681 [Bacteroidota bacterium]|jgi:hypothetical protein